MKCPKCQKENEGNFCSACGTKLETTSQLQLDSEGKNYGKYERNVLPKAQKPKKKGCLVVVLVAVGIMLLPFVFAVGAGLHKAVTMTPEEHAAYVQQIEETEQEEKEKERKALAEKAEKEAQKAAEEEKQKELERKEQKRIQAEEKAEEEKREQEEKEKENETKVSYEAELVLMQITEDVAKQIVKNPGTLDFKTMYWGFAREGKIYAVQGTFECSNLLGVTEEHDIQVWCKANDDFSKIQPYKVVLDGKQIV